MVANGCPQNQLDPHHRQREPMSEQMLEQGAVLNASPTKDFFIHMLTRDVPLSRAIIDLIDNCVDGAHRHSTNGDYRGYHVRIDANENQFRIEDNCGGISIEVAKLYAFRFGRPPEVDAEPGSIGQFGVGMKRSIFKIGSYFRVLSKTANSAFKVEENIKIWKQIEGEWNFHFTEMSVDAPELPNNGTLIEVSELHPTVKISLAQDSFLKTLSKEIEAAHALAIERGLQILLNGLPINFHLPTFVTSDHIQPAYISQRHSSDSGYVDVKIYAGVAEEKSRWEGGWYIFCNGRQVLGPDQTALTGWGDGGTSIPKYHADFAYFRGFVFFDSLNPSLLPWTTTKTGVDTDSPIFQAVKLQMIAAMRPVLDFLRRLEQERSAAAKRDEETGDAERPLQETLAAARTISHSEVKTQQSFVATTPLPTRVPRSRTTQRIQYDRSIELIKQVKDSLGARSLREVGEMTFNYYYDLECKE